MKVLLLFREAKLSIILPNKGISVSESGDVSLKILFFSMKNKEVKELTAAMCKPYLLKTILRLIKKDYLRIRQVV